MNSSEPRQGERSAPSRRGALAMLFGGGLALVGGAASLALGFLSNAWRQVREHPWLRLGPAENLDTETFQRRVLAVPHVHAWRRETRPRTVYVRDRYPDDPLCLDATCSHLGCAVRWDGEARRFRCPCHGGEYDEEGRVVAGPPPLDLTRLEVRLDEAEDVFVRFPDGEEGAA